MGGTGHAQGERQGLEKPAEEGKAVRMRHAAVNPRGATHRRPLQECTVALSGLRLSPFCVTRHNDPLIPTRLSHR